MRIIGGKYKSRRIRMPVGVKIRPTKDRIREALFNIIGGFVPGASVMDAFAGSGAFGIEAVSKGAERAVFIDREKKCVNTINDNLRALDIDGCSIRVLEMDVFTAFKSLERGGEKFDLVLLDPPYHKGLAKKSLIKLNHHDILKDRFIIVAEHHKKDILPAELSNITSYRTVCYGDISLTFYKARAS